MSKASDYIRIARPDHWIKNLFVLPGIPLALFFFPQYAERHILPEILLGLLAACIIASSNYVLNELLDAQFDQFHPEKKDRPLAAGRISRPLAWLEWATLSSVGLATGFAANVHTGWACVTFWIFALLYNVPPIRTKELTYFDVMTESINNAIRLSIGWYATGVTMFPPVSALFAYWMFGSFLMATKRFAEYRRIGDPGQAGLYRRSFRHYTEESLIVSIVFYIAMFVTGLSVFMMQYKHELVLGMPFLAYMIAYYLYLGFQPNSPTQYPEHLYKEKHLMLATIFCAVFFLVLFFVDFPLVSAWFDPLPVQRLP
jgi:4-hydroxybenzoate polyprenyltransferase